MSCYKPILIPNKSKDPASRNIKFQSVPCGKCIGCLQDRQDAWSYRLFCEQSSSKHSLFVTLTYDPAYLPLVLYSDNSIIRYSDYIKRKSIEDCEVTLYPKDFTDFMKRLRKPLIQNDLKYFCCGEYGDDGRPHYHFALFYTKNDSWQVECQIDKAWNMGFVTKAPVIFERIQYLTKYITDKSLFTAKKPIQVDYFNRSSQGIGIEGYLTDAKYYNSSLFTTQLPDGKVINLPRYFRKKFLIDCQLNSYKIYKSIENDDKHRKAITDRLRQDAKIKCGRLNSQRIDEYVQSRIDYERIESVHKQRKLRKKDF